jgi:DNA polymerase II small subunit/DNA polymerase delta subunit B
MDEENIIKLFLKNGFQLSKKTLPLVESDPEFVVAELNKLIPRPFFVTEEHIKNILMDTAKFKPKTIKEYKKTRKDISIDDYVSCMFSYYEKIKNIILEKMSKEKLISINKISPQLSVFSIIGIVREKKEKCVLLEDPSGEISVYFDNGLQQKLVDIKLDDIVGLDCKKTKEGVCAKNVYFPDILSSREIKKTETEMKIAILSYTPSLENEKFQKLISTLSKEKNLSLVFIFSVQPPPKELLKFNLISIPQNSNPKLIQISNIKTLILPKDFFTPAEKTTEPMKFILSILKRRNIAASFDSLLNFGGNCFVLDEIPDIVVSNFNENAYKNYKGTTIISNSDPTKFFLIDLKTREIEEKTL